MEKIDQILESLYDRVIEPLEAKEQLLLLFGVMESVCDCGKPIDSRYAPCCSLKCWDKKFL